MKRGILVKIFSIFITLAILLLIVFSAPAEAYIVSLTTSNTQVDQGDKVTYTATISTENDESLNFDNLTLKLLGPIEVTCKFAKDGTIISGCFGITISNVSTESFGGYGYEQGKITYKIIIDTEEYDTGDYTSKIIMNVNGEDVVKEGTSFSITPTPPLKMKSCSIRADKGTLIVEGTMLGSKNKISFFIPNFNAVSGEGYLSGQNNRERFSYRFTVDKVIKNTPDTSIIAVKGYYRFKRMTPIYETAKITLDKKNKKINIIGTNIEAIYMDINLKEGCNI